MDIENCHRLTKPIVSFIHFQCPFCIKVLHKQHWLFLLLPLESIHSAIATHILVIGGITA